MARELERGARARRRGGLKTRRLELGVLLKDFMHPLQQVNLGLLLEACWV